MTVVHMPQKTTNKGDIVFNHGLCHNCCSSKFWFLACCCPCFAYGKNRTRLLYLTENHVAHPEGGDSFGGECLTFWLLNACFGAGWIMELLNRGDVRRRYHITGNGCSDCCAAWACSPCSMTQIDAQIRDEEVFLMLQHGQVVM